MDNVFGIQYMIIGMRGYGWSALTQISDYLNSLNLYRQRVWTCKVTGKMGLTYEEAMVSEQRASEKVLQLPKEFMAPALRIIQYSKSYSLPS